MARRGPHPGLVAAAERIVDDERAWTVVGVTTLLIDALRTQGTRITQRARDDCYDAAAIALAKHEEKLREQNPETFEAARARYMSVVENDGA